MNYKFFDENYKWKISKYGVNAAMQVYPTMPIFIIKIQ